jgi:site-specific DNA recombinase
VRLDGTGKRSALPYFREEALGDRLARVLKDIHIPDDVLAQLRQSLLSHQGHEDGRMHEQRTRAQQRLAAVRHRMDQAYLDKLDGKISEEFWSRRTAEWQADEQQSLLALQALDEPHQPARALDRIRILELANKAYALYLTQPPTERAQLLKMVLSNCTVDAVSVYPTYRTPFDLIFKRAKTEEWCARQDSNLRPPA